MNPDPSGAGERELDFTLLLALGGLVAVSALAVDISLPATALIASDLATDSNRAQLVVTLYLAGFACGQIPAGIAADRYGRRRTIVTGLGIFILASFVCALSRDFQLLVIARLIQGFSAAVGPVVSRAIVRDLAHGERAAHLMSLLVTILTIAPLLAPSLGSLVILLSGWRGVFWVTGIFGLFVLLVSRVRLGLTEPLQSEKDGILSQFIYGVRRFFSEPQCLFGLSLITLPMAAYLAFITSASVMMADIYQVSAEAFGPMFSISALGFLVGAVFSRRYVRRLGILLLIRLGVICLAISAVLFGLGWGFEVIELPLFWLFMSIYMLGCGMIGPSAQALILNRVPEMAGRAAAIGGTVQMAFGALGSFLVATFYDGTLTALVGLIVICASSALLVAFTSGRFVSSTFR